MTAADSYPLLADFASRPSGRVATLNAKRREAAAALDEIDRLRALVYRVSGIDPRCTDGEYDYAVCGFCGGGQLERDEQAEPGHVVTDHCDESAFVLRFVRIEHEPDCTWLACRQGNVR